MACLLRYALTAFGRLSLMADAVTTLNRNQLPEFPSEPEDTGRGINPKYHSSLVSLMSFTLGQSFGGRQQFGVDALRRLTPTHIVRWMNNKAYGTPTPDYNQDKPTGCRVSTIEYMKKAVSWYMPDHHQWTDATTPSSGNPTKSKKVINLIAVMRRAEVQGQGAAPQSRRDLTMQEFRKAIALSRAKGDFDHVCKYPTMLAWQFTLVGRGDDICHLKILDLHPHPIYDFAMKTKVTWSKNVVDERGCPPQILLGAMDTTFCILLNTGIYLESWIAGGHANTSPFIFCSDGDPAKGPKNVGRVYRQVLKAIYEDPEFRALAELLGGLLGIHSIRKFASTFAKVVGRSADDIDVRARWKRLAGRMIGRYINVDQPIIDTICCQSLCVGGAIAYKVHPDARGVTSAWLLENVCPNIHAYYNGGSNSVALILAKAVLWGCMDPDVQLRIPTWHVTRVLEAYDMISTMEAGINPIVRQPIQAFRVEDALEIQEFGPPCGGGGGDGHGGGGGGDSDDGQTTTARESTAYVSPALAGQRQLQEVANVSQLQKQFADQVMVSIREVKQRITNTDLSQQALLKQQQSVILQELQKLNSNLCRQVSCWLCVPCSKYCSYYFVFKGLLFNLQGWLLQLKPP
jgi:hypothetical protein